MSIFEGVQTVFLVPVFCLPYTAEFINWISFWSVSSSLNIWANDFFWNFGLDSWSDHGCFFSWYIYKESWRDSRSLFRFLSFFLLVFSSCFFFFFFFFLRFLCDYVSSEDYFSLLTHLNVEFIFISTRYSKCIYEGQLVSFSDFTKTWILLRNLGSFEWFYCEAKMTSVTKVIAKDNQLFRLLFKESRTYT